MKHTTYNHRHATRLLPLLGAIGREIEERLESLAMLEERIETLGSLPGRKGELHRHAAEAATHRRGIRLARQELERLGCSVLGMAPLTFRIPGRVGEAKHSFVWQTGDPVLE